MTAAGLNWGEVVIFLPRPKGFSYSKIEIGMLTMQNKGAWLKKIELKIIFFDQSDRRMRFSM